MAFITTGLTKNAQGNEGVTAHYAFSYDSTLQKSAANPTGPEPARTNLAIAGCENDYNLMTGWFGGIALNVNFPITVQVATSSNGAAWSLSNGNLTVTIGSVEPDSTVGDENYLRYLLIAEMTEQFMRTQNKGWYGQGTEGSEGEGLSRFLATQFLLQNGLGYPNPAFANSNSWMSSSRADSVNNIALTDDGPDAATGCSLLFIYYLFTQLGFNIDSIVAAAAPTLAGVYANLTGDTSDPFPFFKQLLDDAYPGTSTIPGPDLDNPYPLGTLSFWDGKNSFGKSEVQDAVSDNNSFTDAFWLVLDGFNRQGWQNLGSPIPAAPSGPASLFPGISFTASGTDFEQQLNLLVPQRIRFAYSVGFTQKSIGAFTTAPQVKELDASITVGGNTFPATTDLEFLGAQDPYFSNIDPQQNNVPWLSQDLRVFTATPNISNQPVAGGPLFTNDSNAGAWSYLQQLLKYLNNNFGDPTGVDPFDITNSILPGQVSAYTGDSSVIPSFNIFGAKFDNYNFGIARVRLRGKTGTASKPVKVFFRLWCTQTCDTDYQTGSTYLSSLDTNSLPSWPLPDPDSTTIPFFATSNSPNFTNANNPELGTGGVNNQPIKINSGDGQWAYFGCFLNVYDQSNIVNGASAPSLLVGTHHCLVAQIAYDDAPILNTNNVVMSPGNCDKLAQRNLQVTLSDNPGSPATHRIPQTFDLRPSVIAAGATLTDPDELMIDWGNTPIGSTANIYWPQVDANQVLQLASQLYGLHALSAPDGHTIQCKVAKSVTYIPIPAGTGANFAGLFSVDLPPTVVKGQEFNVLVRRITTRRLPELQTEVAVNKAAGSVKKVAAPRKRVGVSGNITPILQAPAGQTPPAASKDARAWRYVVGAFQIKIPVSTKDTSLPLEENTLAIFKWRLQEMSPSNRWYPVLLRYISYISARVDGLGGNSSTIIASPGGVSIAHKQPCEGVVEHTGKICEVLYDCFGDFVGFVLKTCGSSHIFKTRQHAIEKVVLRACKEQLQLSVYVEHGHEENIRRLIVRC